MKCKTGKTNLCRQKSEIPLGGRWLGTRRGHARGAGNVLFLDLGIVYQGPIYTLHFDHLKVKIIISIYKIKNLKNLSFVSVISLLGIYEINIIFIAC